MKTAEIIKVADGYEIILHTDDFTPSGYPIIQSVKRSSLKQILDDLRGFYGEDDGEKKGG